MRDPTPNEIARLIKEQPEVAKMLADANRLLRETERERDQYREALEQITTEHDPDCPTGAPDCAACRCVALARQALADQEKIDPGHPLACACPDCDDSRPPADQEPKR